MSAIDEKYASLGGPGGFLGKPVDEGAGDQEMETSDRRGRCRDFERGSLYWSPQTGAHEIHGDIRVHWARTGSLRFLGFPLTDETSTPDRVGRYNHFERGSIYWTPQLGAHEVHGDIRAEWARLGWERSRLGYPTSDEKNTSDGTGRQSDFQGGVILWWPGRGVDVRFHID